MSAKQFNEWFPVIVVGALNVALWLMVLISLDARS